MTDTTRLESYPPSGRSQNHSLPCVELKIHFIQKLLLIVNANATLAAMVAAIILTIMNQHDNIHEIVLLSKLALCFIVGAAVSMMSVILDLVARKMYLDETLKKGVISKFAEVVDFSSLGAIVASACVFAWGVWSGASSLQNVVA